MDLIAVCNAELALLQHERALVNGHLERVLVQIQALDVPVKVRPASICAAPQIEFFVVVPYQFVYGLHGKFPPDNEPQ